MEKRSVDIGSRIFHTEEDCETYLMNMRWPSGFCCPRCDHSVAYSIESRRLLECSSCKMQVSFTAGTIMHKSKLPLLVWFRALQVIIQDESSCTPSSLSAILGINYRSARLLLQKINFAYLKQENRIQLFEKMKKSVSKNTLVNLDESEDQLDFSSELQVIVERVSEQSTNFSYMWFRSALLSAIGVMRSFFA
ncbi:transposase [Paenibacillus sp. SI8]|uniref:transposase n=1 Tax=unclassified Paenibacillus TaxID=185978 RepID=UPI003465E747